MMPDQLENEFCNWLLRIPAIVKNCVHMTAMHELRKHFPLDAIDMGGQVPEGYLQIAYPGSHSDVGGGYAPGELGVSVGKDVEEGDSLKLSQIPLNHMYQYAVKAGVPLSKSVTNKRDKSYDPFTIAPSLSIAFSNFLNASGNSPRLHHEWMQPYLNWRWQIRLSYSKSSHVSRSNSDDKFFLIQSNNQLIEHADLIMRRGNLNRSEKHVLSVKSGERSNIYDKRYSQIQLLDDEASKVLADARGAKPVPQELAYFFDNFVHDSLAGFRKQIIENTGYWRYRKAFHGSDQVTFASNESEEPNIDAV